MEPATGFFLMKVIVFLMWSGYMVCLGGWIESKLEERRRRKMNENM